MQRENEPIGIVNSSPLIYLGKLGLLDLLNKFFPKVITVQTVKEEVLDEASPEYPALQNAFSDWLAVSDDVETSLSVNLKEMGLHQGEVDVISLALRQKEEHNNVVVIIDDLAAREVVRALGMQLTGTVGVILRASTQGILSNKESIAKINFLVESTSFRISPSLYSRVISELMK